MQFGMHQNINLKKAWINRLIPTLWKEVLKAQMQYEVEEDNFLNSNSAEPVLAIALEVSGKMKQ